MNAERIKLHAIRWVDEDGMVNIEVPLRRAGGGWTILSCDGCSYVGSAAEQLQRAERGRQFSPDFEDIERIKSLFAMAELMAQLEKDTP